MRVCSLYDYTDVHSQQPHEDFSFFFLPFPPPFLSSSSPSFFPLLPSFLYRLQRSLLLPDHRHPGVIARLSVLAMLADPPHGHVGVHPRHGRGKQRKQRSGFLRGHRPTAEPDQRLQPRTWSHRQSLPVSPFVHVCVCGRGVCEQ